ncbi:MAG TPA: helix-turn-helix domain-containing protein [Mycobacteriales bacterium]|nr:helix-turn-helix domain-containing protein [Mycobacteriales bacterium]
MAEQKKPVVIEDPRAIRALAHPARLEAIDRLYGGDVSTATELADATGLSASAMSYHLRELLKWGVIERVTDGGDGRERRWRAAGTTLQIGSGRQSTALKSAEMTLLGHMLDRLRSNIEDYLQHSKDEPEQWKDGLSVGSYDLLVTAEELSSLNDEVGELLQRYDRRRSDRPADGHHLRFTAAAVPIRKPPTGRST